MGFRMSSGGTNAGSAVITNFDSGTKIATVEVRNQFGALAANGTAVDIYVDGGGSPYASGTVAGGAGIASITLTGLSTATAHTIVPKTTLSVVYTGTGLSYVPAFGTAAFTGTQAIRKTTGGLNPTADNATATLTVSGGVITGVGANTGGGNYDPLGWQPVTASGGNTTPFRGEVQAKSDGTLDWTTLAFTGTGHDGVALNAGAGYAGSTSAAIITRRTKYLAMFVRLRQTTGAVNGDLLLNSVSSILNVPMLTGFKLRLDAGSGPAYRATQTAALSSTDFADYFAAIDLGQTAYNSTPDPGQQLYYNDADNGPNPPAAFISNGIMDFSNTNMGALTIGANQTGTANFLHADVQAIWIAWGMAALDTATGKVVAFRNQAVRDRAKAGVINTSDGTGITGRAPQVFLTGSNIPTGVNLGTGGNFGTIVGTF